jgi:hypothetical protein
VAVGVDVEVGAELVHQGGQVLELFIEALGAGKDFARLVRLLMVSACSLRYLV